MSDIEAEGFVRFNITAAPDEMKHWSPERITKFFNGIAQVVHAAGQRATVELWPIWAEKLKGSTRRGKNK